MPDPREARLEFLLFSLAIPALAMVVASLAESGGARRDDRRVGFAGRVAQLGWDGCVLALGADGGILAHPAVAQGFSTPGMMVATEVIVILVTFALALTIARMRNVREMSLPGAFMILALGGAALGIPVYLITHLWRV